VFLNKITLLTLIHTVTDICEHCYILITAVMKQKINPLPKSVERGPRTGGSLELAIHSHTVLALLHGFPISNKIR
jgi:hypothetical protein